MVPPAEAPGSPSPARPRTPPRTCSGLRPPEEGRAQASRKVREQGQGRPHPGAGRQLHSRGLRPGPVGSSGSPPGPTSPGRPALVARSVPPSASPARSSSECPCGPRSGDGSRRRPQGWVRSRPAAAGRGAARGCCARWRSLREAALGPGRP